jgi:hypothetical protein
MKQCKNNEQKTEKISVLPRKSFEGSTGGNSIKDDKSLKKN